MFCKGILLILSIATVFGNDLLDKARQVKTCGKFQERKCVDDQAAVYYTMTNPGKCLIKECILKPSVGYTEHPERNLYVQLMPKKFQKRIIYTFDEIRAKTCGFQNQPCSCKSEEKCTCDNDRLKICKQKYRYERKYFLVVNTDKRPTEPVNSYQTQNQQSYQTQNQQPYQSQNQQPYQSQNQQPYQTQNQQPYQSQNQQHYQQPQQQYYPNQGQTNAQGQHNYQQQYGNPAQNSGYGNPNTAGHDSKSDDWYSMTRNGEIPSYYPAQNSGASNGIGGSSILQQLMMQKMMGGSGGGSSGMMKYLLMSQMMNKPTLQQQKPVGYNQGYGNQQQQNQPSNGYQQQTTQQKKIRQKVPKHGTVFNPTMLYYMMKSNNKGSESGGSKFLQILPMLMGNNQMFGGQLELKSLWVEIPHACECESRDETVYEEEDDDDIFSSLIPYLIGGGSANPLAAIMGGGVTNPLAALMGGAGGNPLAGLSGVPGMGLPGTGGNSFDMLSLIMNQQNQNSNNNDYSNSFSSFHPY